MRYAAVFFLNFSGCTLKIKRKCSGNMLGIPWIALWNCSFCSCINHNIGSHVTWMACSQSALRTLIGGPVYQTDSLKIHFFGYISERLSGVRSAFVRVMSWFWFVNLRSRTHFTSNCSISIQTRWEFHFVFIHILMNLSLSSHFCAWRFAHTTSDVLS